MSAREQYKHASRLWRSVWRTFLTDRPAGPLTHREAFLQAQWKEIPWRLRIAAMQNGIDWLAIGDAAFRLRMKRGGRRISFR